MFLFSSFWYLEGIPVVGHCPFKVWQMCAHPYPCHQKASRGFEAFLPWLPFHLSLSFSYFFICTHTHKIHHFKVSKSVGFFFFSVYLQCCVTSPLSNSRAFLSPPRKLPLCKVVNSIPRSFQFLAITPVLF